MKKATLATVFAELRRESGMAMLEIANRCEISESTVWKVENGKSVRWETVHLILTVAMGVHAGTPRYQSFQALWLKHRQEMAESQSPDFGTKRMSPAAVAAVRKFRTIVHDLDRARIQKVMAAVARTANQSDKAPRR